MKKFFKVFAFAAVAAGAITACNKEVEISTPVEEQEYVYTFAIGEDATMTKAVLASDANGKFAQWEDGDQLGSITTKSSGYSNVTPASGGAPATFSIYSKGGLTAGNTITVWYPYGGATQSDATAVSLEIPEEQNHLSDGTFDFDAMPMVAKQITVTDEMESASNQTPLETINFANLGSVLNFKVFSTSATYAGEKVKSITFNAKNEAGTADANIGGTFEKNLATIDPDTESTMTIPSFTAGVSSIVTKPYASASIGTSKATSLDLYMVVAPGTYKGTIVIVTDAATYTYTLSTAKSLVRSGIKAFGLDLGSATATRVANTPIVKGAEWNYTFENNPFSAGSASLTSGTVTLDWTASPNPASYTNDALSFGTNNDPAAATLSTSSYTDGVSSVKIAIKGNSKKDVTAAVIVDGTNLKCEGNNTVTQSGNTLTEYEFIASELLQGTISIVFTNPTGGYQIKSIVINNKSNQSLSFTEDVIEWIIGTDCELNNAKQGQVVSGAKTTVSYESSDNTIAEVDNDGKVTPKKAGSVTITATAEEDADYYSASNSYELTITDPNATTADHNAIITFGTNDVKINSASVTGDDSEGNTWTITTVGTTSFTTNASYYQVGSGNKPATSITFTTTLAKNATIKDMSAKFGGFSGTAGTVTLKVGDTTIGSGSLNGSNDVTINATNKTTVGKVLTVTVTDISKGVKVYFIDVTYNN